MNESEMILTILINISSFCIILEIDWNIKEKHKNGNVTLRGNWNDEKIRDVKNDANIR